MDAKEVELLLWIKLKIQLQKKSRNAIVHYMVYYQKYI